MKYYLKKGNFYYNDKKIFTLKRNDYLLFSILKIVDIENNMLIKCRVFPLLGFKLMKILDQGIINNIIFEKDKKSDYLITKINGEKYKITVKTSNNLFSLKVKGDFIVNNEERGTVLGKMDDFFNSSYHFEFVEQNKELNFYCLIFFALRYYYIEDVA
ncbi:hypothetical protein [Myroides sp. DW712]|uniref:hypothetical protein n=1 Tax=Myroides sp. DW712 TaxID=3389800 RepID=UPI00397835E4